MDTVSTEVEWFLARAKRQTPKLLRAKRGMTVVTAAKRSYKSGSPYAHTKTGYRPELDLTVRSGWEANVLRVLKSYDIPFEYEPHIFTFERYKRGNKSYLPDIYLPTTSEYVEIKGYFDKKSQIKMRRFMKCYPEEAQATTMIISRSSKVSREFCELVGYKVLYYEEIVKHFKKLIPTWE